MLIVSLAMFLTYFVMEPTFVAAYEAGVAPLVAEEIDLATAFAEASEPFRLFMAGRVDPDTLARMAELRPDADPLGPARGAAAVDPGALVHALGDREGVPDRLFGVPCPSSSSTS